MQATPEPSALHRSVRIAALCALAAGSASVNARAQLDVTSKGQLGTETRVFYPDGESATDVGNAAMSGRLQADADVGEHLSSRGRAFLRLDPYDSARTRIVPEEVYVQGEVEPLRLRVGYQMLNWSATEAFHPADVVNSRILDGGFENPEKIGEPIAALRVEIPYGNVELYAMPVFTAPVLPSTRSPLGFLPPGFALGEALVIERDGEIDDMRLQPQWGAQVQQTWGDADIAVHVLQHIDREAPSIVMDAASFELRPLFGSVTQLGLTYQHALDGTMFKLEGAYRMFKRADASARQRWGAQPERNHAMLAAGVERAFGRPDGSELTLLLEGQVLIPAVDRFPELLEPLFQHDVLIGMRHAFNDEQSLALLFTVIVDVEDPDQLVVGASLSRRLGDEWGATLGLRLLRVPPENDAVPVGFERLHDQHQLYLDLQRYF